MDQVQSITQKPEILGLRVLIVLRYEIESLVRPVCQGRVLLREMEFRKYELPISNHSQGNIFKFYEFYCLFRDL